MFNGNVVIERVPMEGYDVRDVIDAGAILYVNPSHQATLSAMEERFNLKVEVPATPPRVSLNRGDSYSVFITSLLLI